MRQLDEATVDHARLVYGLRRQRDRLLGEYASLVGEPVWDMLLDLFVAHHEGRKVGACSATIGACTAPTTGLRCIGSLSQQGLVVRSPDPDDGRRSFIALSDRGIALMERVLSTPDPAR